MSAFYPLRERKMETDRHSFLLTSMSKSKQAELVKKIKELGSFVFDSDKPFDKSVTHLICGSLKKTEKFIGACITGKWILTSKFVEDSHQVGMWLDETDYFFKVNGDDPLKDNLAMAARRWWDLVNTSNKVPFVDWQVSLLTTAEKASCYKRLLIYGGANIFKLRKPFSKCGDVHKITYVFVDEFHATDALELQDLGVLCLKENFLGDFILKDPEPDPFDYIIINSNTSGGSLDMSVSKPLKRSRSGVHDGDGNTMPTPAKLHKTAHVVLDRLDPKLPVPHMTNSKNIDSKTFQSPPKNQSVKECSMIRCREREKENFSVSRGLRSMQLNGPRERTFSPIDSRVQLNEPRERTPSPIDSTLQLNGPQERDHPTFASSSPVTSQLSQSSASRKVKVSPLPVSIYLYDNQSHSPGRRIDDPQLKLTRIDDKNKNNLLSEKDTKCKEGEEETPKPNQLSHENLKTSSKCLSGNSCKSSAFLKLPPNPYLYENCTSSDGPTPKDQKKQSCSKRLFEESMATNKHMAIPSTPGTSAGLNSASNQVSRVPKLQNIRIKKMRNASNDQRNSASKGLSQSYLGRFGIRITSKDKNVERNERYDGNSKDSPQQFDAEPTLARCEKKSKSRLPIAEDCSDIRRNDSSSFIKPISNTTLGVCRDQNENIQLTILPQTSWPLSFCLNPMSSNSDGKQFLPPIVSQCMEASRENGFYNTALDHGRPTLTRKPDVNLLKQFVNILTCCDTDETVKYTAFSSLLSWAENYPPTFSMVAVYSDLFDFDISLGQTALLDQMLEGLIELPADSATGNLFLFEFVVGILEMNFSWCLKSQNKQTVKECLLVKWLWVHSEGLYINKKINKLLQVFKIIISSPMPQINSKPFDAMASLVSLIAECFRLSSVNWNMASWKYQSDLTKSFSFRIAKLIRDVCLKEDPFYFVSHIHAFQRTWFRMMITAAMLSFLNDHLLYGRIQDLDITLKTIVTQYFFLLPALSAQGIVTKKSANLSSSHQFTRKGSVISACGEKSRNVQVDRKNLTASKINKRNPVGESTVHIAAKVGNFVKLEKLLSVPGVDVNMKDNNGWTPLHEACNHGRYACVELLLKYIPPNTLESFFNKKTSVSSKVDINALGPEGITPLHDAVMHNRVNISKLLLKHGGKHLLETKTVYGYTAIDLATTQEMANVLNSSLNDATCSFSSLNLSQDSQSEESFNISQSEYCSLSMDPFPMDSKYEEVIDATNGILAASFDDCSVFISLITLLLTSYLESMSGTVKNEHANPVILRGCLMEQDEKLILGTIRFHMKLFKKHLRRITSQETFERLQSHLLILTAASGVGKP